MLQKVLQQVRVGIIVLILLTMLTGVFYPLMITGLAQLLFSHVANGSLLQWHNEIIGSKLIGQEFNENKYFWGRPSATKSFPYNSQESSGSNFASLNQNYFTKVNERIKKLNTLATVIPIDLVTASASGLDPEISPYAAYFQIPRVASARNIPMQNLKVLVDKQINKRVFGFLGEPRVNVLLLNLTLDELKL